MRTAAEASLVSCHACRKLSRVQRLPPNHDAVCPRCGSHLHQRKTNSLSRTWALVIAACILYIPANVYPVMTVIWLGQGHPDTILSGVKAFILSGDWPLALLIFFASIMVPGLKLVGLTYLMISVQRKSHWRPRDRTALYRITEVVGRWSMIDVFMISILVALVQLGSVATIEAGVGATCFAAVVVMTMIAATQFDPRLIWDAMEDER